MRKYLVKCVIFKEQSISIMSANNKEEIKQYIAMWTNYDKTLSINDITISKHGAYFLAQKIKKRSINEYLKGWILIYPHYIGYPLSTNYIFITDEEYKQERLSKDYIELLELDLQEFKNYTIKNIQLELLNKLINQREVN